MTRLERDLRAARAEMRRLAREARGVATSTPAGPALAQAAPPAPGLSDQAVLARALRVRGI